MNPMSLLTMSPEHLREQSQRQSERVDRSVRFSARRLVTAIRGVRSSVRAVFTPK